jgi:N-dimethylarginine dimethylaminohydrolase
MINQLAETKKETMPPAPRRFYLTKPTQFQIEYSINKWMDPRVQVDLPKAQQQWDALLKTYKELGAEVEVFEPLEGWPDSVFTGDSIFLYGKHAIASRFRFAERAGEVPATVERFRQRGYTVHELPEGMYFEGNGEAVYWNGRVIAGYGVRSDREALDFMSKTLSVEVVPLRLRAPHFHVDTTICPLNDSTLAYVPTALDEDGQKAVKALNANLIHINNEEARLLACNSMSVAGNVVLSTVHAPKFHAALEKAGFEVRPLDLSEFAKSGGGAKCLTLEAYNPT